MINMSRLNIEYFMRDYLSLKSGNGKVNLEPVATLRRKLIDISSELEEQGYSIEIDIKPQGYYTEEDIKSAIEEGAEVDKDISSYFEEML